MREDALFLRKGEDVCLSGKKLPCFAMLGSGTPRPGSTNKFLYVGVCLSQVFNNTLACTTPMIVSSVGRCWARQATDSKEWSNQAELHCWSTTACWFNP